MGRERDTKFGVWARHIVVIEKDLLLQGKGHCCSRSQQQNQTTYDGSMKSWGFQKIKNSFCEMIITNQ